MITEYEVGQIPAEPLGVEVRDDAGNLRNLTVYSTITLEVLGSNNEKVDLTGVELFTEAARNGQIAVYWPKNRSIFNKQGDYLLRLALRDAEGSLDYTRPGTIRVRRFGGKN